MGACVFCGDQAGFFHSRHRACEAKNAESREMIKARVRDGLRADGRSLGLREEISGIARNGRVTGEQERDAIVAGWSEAVEQFFEDGVLSKDEEDRLERFRDLFDLSESTLDAHGAFSRVKKGAVLRELLEGRLPACGVDGRTLRFNFQKNETLVRVFQEVTYCESRTRTQYVGGTHGLSIRIAKGIYYRAGRFKGRPVTTSETVLVDTGSLAVTTKHIYFGGESKSFRVRFSKIVSFTPYTDGIGIQRDAARARPQVFGTGDGWFTYNLVKNVARL